MDWQNVLDTLAEALADSGGEAWLVGGCVRDALLGLPVADVDVAMSVEPLPIAERLARRLSLAVARLGHETIRLASRATPQQYLDLTPLYGENITTDLAGRDFTVNALALPLAARDQWMAAMSGARDTMADLFDPFGGRDDLQARRLVAVGPEVFRYDPGRIIRAARMWARFGLYPDAGTLRLAREAAPLLGSLSDDRTRTEMDLLLALPSATAGVELLDTLGALAILYPGLDEALSANALATLRQLDLLMGVKSDQSDQSAQAAYPALHTWSATATRQIALRQAALRYAHGTAQARDGSRKAACWRQALAVLNTDDDEERFYAARMMFARAGKDEHAAADALLVAAAATLATDAQRGAALAARANHLLDIYLHHRELLIPPPLLSGKDLMTELALPPGPGLGQLLNTVRLAQLAGEVNDRAEALALARRLSGA